MPKPGDLWTLAQAHVWVALASSDLASPDEFDALLREVEADFEAKGRTSAWAYLRAQRFHRLRDDELGDEADRARARENRTIFDEHWNAAEAILLREIRGARVSVYARLNQPSSDLAPLTRLELDGIRFGQDGSEHDLARRPTDYEWRWRSIRFEAAEIVRRWPGRSGGEVAKQTPPKPAAKADAMAVLAKIADKSKTKISVREELRSRFPGRHISDGMFERLYAKLPNDKKRLRGETDKTLRRANNIARG